MVSVRLINHTQTVVTPSAMVVLRHPPQAAICFATGTALNSAVVPIGSMCIVTRVRHRHQLPRQPRPPLLVALLSLDKLATGFHSGATGLLMIAYDEAVFQSMYHSDNVNGRALPNGEGVTGAMTNAKCTTACLAAGYSLAGTEYAG